MIEEKCMPQYARETIETQLKLFRNGASYTRQTEIPHTRYIPIDTDPERKVHWLQIPDVTSVFVDMINSTKLSAFNYPENTAKLYQLFTGTAVRIFNDFEAPYIDVRGDGVFALFNHNQCYRALAAAVTFKTFAEKEFIPQAQRLAAGLEIGAHIGIDRETVLVRKLGLRRRDGDNHAQNEVWAGKPVNMSAKLASVSKNKELHVSDRFYRQIDNDLVTKSCGCPTGVPKPIWDRVSLSDYDMFKGIRNFEYAYQLRQIWCELHGAEWCSRILKLDQ